jgi:hypothetical protein
MKLTSFQQAETLRELEFTRAELHDLVLATERQCQCSLNETGAVAIECVVHVRLHDQTALKRLLFVRRFVHRWRAGEFDTLPRAAA